MRRPLLGITLAVIVGISPSAAQQSPTAVARPAGREPILTIGGLIQAQADFGDRGDSRFTNDNDRFYLRRARLNATGKFLEEFDFRLELDLAGSLTNTSALRAQATDAYITWNRYHAAIVRVGQFKTPFGFEQLYGDPRLATLERSLVNDRLTLSRQIGVQVSGDLADKRLTYAVGAFNGNGTNNNFNDDDRFLIAARGAGVPWRGGLNGIPASWTVGANGYQSHDANVPQGPEFGFDSTPATPDRDAIFSGDRRGWGIDSQLVFGRFDLWGEYLSTRWEPESRRPSAVVESSGWYAQAGLYVVPERLQVVLKEETFDPRTDHSGDTTTTDTAGINYFFKGHDLKLMVDYLRVQANRDPDQNKVLARLQVIF
ncbi:MAG TPA: porin [Thermoanaerobaculia bacterium]|nr:porin [Thermoanaerobaculia bacterium]